jgi:threonine aldolase
MLFPRLSAGQHRELKDAGAVYHLWDGTLDGAADDAVLTARLVCDWSMTDAAVDEFLAVLG